MNMTFCEIISSFAQLEKGLISSSSKDLKESEIGEGIGQMTEFLQELLQDTTLMDKGSSLDASGKKVHRWTKAEFSSILNLLWKSFSKQNLDMQSETIKVEKFDPFEEERRARIFVLCETKA